MERERKIKQLNLQVTMHFCRHASYSIAAPVFVSMLSLFTKGAQQRQQKMEN